MPHEKSMIDAELECFEASQDFEALLAQSAREMSDGETHEVVVLVAVARKSAATTQADTSLDDVDCGPGKDA